MLRTDEKKPEEKRIIMDRGDYGLPLVMRIANNNGQVVETDKVSFKIKYDDEIVIEQTYPNLSLDENGILYFTFSLTKEESEKLVKNRYTYEVEVYRDGEYLNTLLNDKDFCIE